MAESKPTPQNQPQPKPQTQTPIVAALTWPQPKFKIDDAVKLGGKQTGLIIGTAKHLHPDQPCWRYLVVPDGVPVQLANAVWFRDDQLNLI